MRSIAFIPLLVLPSACTGMLDGGTAPASGGMTGTAEPGGGASAESVAGPVSGGSGGGSTGASGAPATGGASGTASAGASATAGSADGGVGGAAGTGGAGGAAGTGGAGGGEPWLTTCPTIADGISLGTVSNTTINEASGLIASRTHQGIFWVHNDSGDSARFFALDDTGTLRMTFNLVGAKAQDWEDMAIGPGPAPGDWLYFGDIGDNGESRATISFVRTPEPAIVAPGGDAQIAAGSYETLVAQYPDGAHNAETLLVDPISGDIYVVTKAGATSGVYRWKAPQLPSGGTHTLERLGAVPHAGSTATGGDVSPRGDFVILKTYEGARLWLRAPGTELHEAFGGTPCTAKIHDEPQGETLAISADGRSYSTLSEGTNRPIWFFKFGP